VKIISVVFGFAQRREEALENQQPEG